MSKLKTLLEKIGRETVQIIDAEIKGQNLIKTGALQKSVQYDVTESGTTYELKFSQIYYGEFLDKGTKYISPREFFDKNISKQMNKYADDIAQATIDDLLTI